MPTTSQTTSIGAAIIIIYVLHKVIKSWSIYKKIGDSLGRRFFFRHGSIFGLILPRIRGIALGIGYALVDKHRSFAQLGHDVETLVHVFPNPKVNILVADAALAKEITSSRARFPKALNSYTILTFFGPNIIASEADDWRRNRKIAAPAFSEKNNNLVWDETMKILNNLFDDVRTHEECVVVDNGLDLTLPLALFVIGSAGFGQTMSWIEESIPPGHTMTFKQALHVTTTDVFPKLLLPEWSLGLTTRWRQCRTGFRELRKYLREMVQERLRRGSLEDRHDLFSGFLAASNSDGDSFLSEDEILGNIYIFLIAGHETTGHNLCLALGLLALYQDEQTKLFDHIISLMPDGRLPSYGDMHMFTRVLAVLNETLRMFPTISIIPKLAGQDTQLTTVNADGERLTIPKGLGTAITIHVCGLHYNSRYWDDPHTFKPERFLGSWNRDAFLPFSGGPRACMGRKFSETEATAALIMLISKYNVSIKEESQFSGETFDQRKDRVLRVVQRITTTPVRVPLVFTRR